MVGLGNLIWMIGCEGTIEERAIRREGRIGCEGTMHWMLEDHHSPCMCSLDKILGQVPWRES